MEYITYKLLVELHGVLPLVHIGCPVAEEVPDEFLSHGSRQHFGGCITNRRAVDLEDRVAVDAIALSFGGQTALNCGIELDRRGVFERHGVRVLGTAVQAIVDTEDREIFSGKLKEIGESCIPNVPCFTMDEVVAAAEEERES